MGESGGGGGGTSTPAHASRVTGWVRAESKTDDRWGQVPAGGFVGSTRSAEAGGPLAAAGDTGGEPGGGGGGAEASGGGGYEGGGGGRLPRLPAGPM
jgi:hypothetical protein